MLRAGLNPSDGAAADPMAGVTRDASSNIYAPANATEWTITMTAAGLATGNPASVWNFQEASGTIADAIGAITLASNMPTYQSPVSGWTRKAVRGTDGSANQRASNQTTAPNPSTTSTLVLAYIDIPAAPVAARDTISVANNADIRYNTNGKLRLVAGASADLVNVAASAVRPVLLKVNNTGSITAVYSDQEKFIGTYVLPTSSNTVSFGGLNATNSAAGYLYAAEWTGAAAELSDANVKTLLQQLGWTIPWS